MRLPQPSHPTLPKILVHISRLHKYDGSSTDLFYQVAGLRRHGYQVYVHSRSTPPDYPETLVSFDEAKRLAAEASTVVLFTFCGFDRQLHELRRVAKGLFIVRYQNVTPPKWFVRYSLRGFIHALLGRLQMHFFIEGKHVDLLMPASQFSADELFQRISSPKRPPVRVVPVQSHYDQFQRLSNRVMSPQVKEKTALYVSRLLPHKGIIHLIKLLEEWKNTESARSGIQLKVVIAGKLSREYETFLKNLQQDASRRDVLSDLSFHTDISQSELISLYHKADIYICPSEHEGFGIPVVDAQSAKLPVIALDMGATAETVGDGAIIVEADPVDYQRFAKAVETILREDEVRMRLITAGTKNLERFSSDVVTAQLLDALRERKQVVT